MPCRASKHHRPADAILAGREIKEFICMLFQKTPLPFLCLLAFAIHQQSERQTIIRNYAAAQSITIVGFWAVEKSKLSSGLKHALNSLKHNHANIIIFDEISTLRLSHNDLAEFLQLLLIHGINIIFAKEDSLVGSSTINTLSQLLINSLQTDKEQRSQKIKKSLQMKKQKGELLGGRKFGSQPNESYVIKQIMKLREQGISLKTICQMLIQNDIKTAQNKTWHPTTVKRILDRASLDVL
jgi:DNA invertase Pin-like site-specific DNA recombinase